METGNRIERWETEIALLVLVIMVSIVMWILLAVSIIGIIYAALIALLFFVSHIGFIAYIRGSAVRIGPDQFPELYRKIEELSYKAGLHVVPEAYLMQAGGTLNAMATKLFASNFIVLYSDLLEACEDNNDARDMIIGHELGHIHAGHLRFIWLLLPGLMFPFIGTAYSRAREYTCDRYGMALANDKQKALRGMAILSAGAKHGPKVNLEVFAKQRESLNTGLMTIGKWLSTHPPLSDRLIAMAPMLYPDAKPHRKGPMTAMAGIVFVAIIPTVVFGYLAKGMMDRIAESAKNSTQIQETADSPKYTTEQLATLCTGVGNDLDALAAVVLEHWRNNGEWPDVSNGTLAVVWNDLRPERDLPKDRFDGFEYAYWFDDSSFVVYSVGPDLVLGTRDDISRWVYSGGLQ